MINSQIILFYIIYNVFIRNTPKPLYKIHHRRVFINNLAVTRIYCQLIDQRSQSYIHIISIVT